MDLDRRLILHQKLVDLLGSPHVYFQPPASVKMEYPCIIYKYADIDALYANNRPYRLQMRYDVTYVSRTMDDDKIKALASLPLCSCDRFYTAENLHHTVFTLYF